MTPLVLGLGVPELLIILAVVLLLFGGARLAGLGKSTGRALREFKEETRALKSEESQSQSPNSVPGTTTTTPEGMDYQQPPQNTSQPPNGATYQQPPRANQDPFATDSRNDV